MRTGALGLILAFLVIACSKDDLSKNEKPSQPPQSRRIIVAVTNEIVTMRPRRPVINLRVKRTGQFHKTSGRPLSRTTRSQRMART